MPQIATGDVKATTLWAHIFGDERGFLQIWSVIPDKDEESEQRSIKSRFFNYPKDTDKAQAYALKLADEDGRNVYFCSHLLKRATKRVKENATNVITLWGDLDGAPLPNGNLTPTAVVESSPGHFHSYWRLTEQVSPELAEQLNKRIAVEIGADPSGFDLTQLLRVPGTANHKYEDAPVVRIVNITDEFHVLEDLDAFLPEIEEPEYELEEDDADEPPIALNPKATKLWRGEEPKVKEDGTGEIDRSASLMKIGRVLYDAGGNRCTVVEGLKERDQALGWNCYTDRRDDREYHRIFDKLKDEGRNPSLYFPVNGSGRGADISDISDIFSRRTKTPAFPVDALPPACARFVKEAAASLMCPTELVAVPVLAALSGAMGYSRMLHIKHGWMVSGSLYAAVVDQPGSRKSPAATFAYKPLEKLQGKLRKDYKLLKEHYEYEMRQHAVDKKVAAKEGNAEPRPPVAPKMKRCIVDDITIEALAVRLEQNPRGFLSAHDELTGFIKGLDQYKTGGKGNARQAYLKIWSNQPIYVDRKNSDEPVVVPSPYVTIQGAIQPGVLHEIADGRDDGFLDRFIFGYPEPTLSGYSNETISYEAEMAYRHVIEGLWSREMQEDDDGDLIPRGVSMTDEAKEMFVDTANSLAKEAHSPGFPEILRGPWAKMDTHLARLALIISVTTSVEQGADTEKVTGEDMCSAIRLLDYFKATARKVYGQLFEASPDDVLAADIFTFLSNSSNVFSGTVPELMAELGRTVDEDEAKSIGKAIRRVVKKHPELRLDSKSDGKRRLISLRLEKMSEMSEMSVNGGRR